jgi:hypothetical protein
MKPPKWVDVKYLPPVQTGPTSFEAPIEIRLKKNIHLLIFFLRHVNWRKSGPKWHPLFWAAFVRTWRRL